MQPKSQPSDSDDSKSYDDFGGKELTPNADDWDQNEIIISEENDEHDFNPNRKPRLTPRSSSSIKGKNHSRNNSNNNRKHKLSAGKKNIKFFDTYIAGISKQKLNISDDGRHIAMQYFSDSVYIICSNGFDSGRHEWQMQCLEVGDLTDEIGVVSAWGDLKVNGNSMNDIGSQQLRCVLGVYVCVVYCVCF